MAETDVRAQCLAAVREALEVYGDPVATAEVLEKVAALHYDGDNNAYVQAVAAVARAVWERKVALAEARTAELHQALTAMSAMRLSNIIH